VATLLVRREQVKTVLVECIRAGEDLVAKAAIVENAGGHSDWLHLFARWKERTIAELKAVYDGNEIPLEFEAATPTAEHSAPRFTFRYRKATLQTGLWELRALVERLPLAVEPQEPSVVTRPASSVVRREDLSPEQTEVIDRLVYAWSDSVDGRWPVYQWFARDVERNCGIELGLIINTFPGDLIRCDRFPSATPEPNATVALTVPGLACAVNPPASAYVLLFLRTLRWIAKCVEEDLARATPYAAVTVEVSGDRAHQDWLRTGADDSPLIVARAGAMLYTEFGIWQSYGGPSSDSRADWKISVSPEFKQFQDVKTIDHYLSIRARQYTPAAAQTSRASPGAEPVQPERRRWDLFVSHASEDKEEFVDELVEELEGRGLLIWYARSELHIGDSLRVSIDAGLAGSEYGVVVLSPNFFVKNWPKVELDALWNLMLQDKSHVLPVLHKLTIDELARHSPMVAGLLAADSDEGAAAIADRIERRIIRDRAI
jgi:hypothetical protein